MTDITNLTLVHSHKTAVEDDAPRVHLDVARFTWQRRHTCCCCGRETWKDSVFIGVWERPILLSGQRDLIGVLCEPCLGGDVVALLEAPPDPCVVEGPIPTIEDLQAARQREHA